MIYDDFDEENIDDAIYEDSAGEDYGDSSDDFDDSDDDSELRGRLRSATGTTGTAGFMRTLLQDINITKECT